MPAPQSLKNHTRFDPLFHPLIACLVVNLVVSISITIHQWPNQPHAHLWWIFLSVVALMVGLRVRIYALKNQDRIIRLEERLRLAALLAPAELAASQALTTPQLIALRFASDGELPGLTRRTIAENLDPKQIKASIVTWRPDYERI